MPNEVTSLGIEAKFMWNPVERVWWDFQAGYTDATFDSHRDATGFSVNDRHVPFIPKYTLRTGVTVSSAKAFRRTRATPRWAERIFDERNTSLFSQKSYGIVNAQVRYRVEHWTATRLRPKSVREELLPVHQS